jgi:hypothetical protein
MSGTRSSASLLRREPLRRLLSGSHQREPVNLPEAGWRGAARSHGGRRAAVGRLTGGRSADWALLTSSPEGELSDPRPLPRRSGIAARESVVGLGKSSSRRSPSEADPTSRVAPDVVAVLEGVLLVALVKVEIAPSCDIFLRLDGPVQLR